MGVIRGVDPDISDEGLMKETSGQQRAKCKGKGQRQNALRMGAPYCVKVVVTGDLLPSRLKAALIRYPVRPFVPRTIYCCKIWAV